MVNRVKITLVLVLGLGGCATSAQVDQRIEEWETAQREEVDALKRAVEASYDRERSLSDRLRQAEEDNSELRQELNTLKSQSSNLRTQFDSLQADVPAPAEVRVRSGKSEVLSIYQGALDQYRNRRYAQALAEFDRLLQKAPFSEWSDNAQYWKGECYYGTSKYRQALTEFAKVFAFRKTEKADDAQLKIARCHLALGERDRALEAFRKLLDEYPDSEYVPTARKEMKYLGG